VRLKITLKTWKLKEMRVVMFRAFRARNFEKGTGGRPKLWWDGRWWFPVEFPKPPMRSTNRRMKPSHSTNHEVDRLCAKSPPLVRKAGESAEDWKNESWDSKISVNFIYLEIIVRLSQPRWQSVEKFWLSAATKLVLNRPIGRLCRKATWEVSFDEPGRMNGDVRRIVRIGTIHWQKKLAQYARPSRTFSAIGNCAVGRQRKQFSVVRHGHLRIVSKPLIFCGNCAGWQRFHSLGFTEWSGQT
jgi:hypothetical protein